MIEHFGKDAKRETETCLLTFLEDEGKRREERIIYPHKGPRGTPGGSLDLPGATEKRARTAQRAFRPPPGTQSHPRRRPRHPWDLLGSIFENVSTPKVREEKRRNREEKEERREEKTRREERREENSRREERK
jgi:hypothetical protein